MDKEQLEKEFYELINSGISLTSEHEIDRLLDKIVTEARRFTHCDGGSLYIKEKKGLKFVVAQNDTLDSRFGNVRRKSSFIPYSLPLNKKSLAGYVAITGETLIIDDVYNIPVESEYQFNRDFDDRNNYHSKSMIVLPLIDTKNKNLGVLELINSVNEKGEIVPFDPHYIRFVKCLASQASVALKNIQFNLEQKKVHLNTLIHLAIAGEYRDDETGNHVKRISAISEIIATHLNLREKDIELIKYSSLMHDIGKVAIPDNILLKKGKLTPGERKIMETHTTKGAEILNDPDSTILYAAHEVALTHHEKFDGTGYPNKLKGIKIPTSGRIVAIADYFDGLYNKRCYKPSFSLDKVINIINEENGKHFDPVVVEAFLNGLEEIKAVCEKYKD